MITPVLSSRHGLTTEDLGALSQLFEDGTSDNTLRAYERDLIYLMAWKTQAFGTPLVWPEEEAVALRFVLDHARDLRGEDGAAATVARALVEQGLRRSLAAPAPSSLDRRIASWRTFHRMRDLASPFDAPLLKQARTKARRAVARDPAPKSAHPITREVLERMCAAVEPGLRGLRDCAILMLGWASGGRRRSEIALLRRDDIGLEDFDANGLVWIRLLETKTTRAGQTPKLVLKGRAARAVVAWIDAAGITEGPLFRRIGRTGVVGRHALSPAGVGQIVKARLVAAGYAADFASAHGLRSGFLTQAAKDGAPLPAAMRLSLHKSAAQAQAYYDEVEITENPASDLLD